MTATPWTSPVASWPPGRLDRVDKNDKRSVIIRDLFAKEADTSKFVGLKVPDQG